jgi:Fur family peroxide stress response transcriptional regulator
MAVLPDELEQRVEAFRQTCIRQGVRITPQRTAVYREVARTEEHPDAETILQRLHERMPHVSLDTVYRTLALLEEMGLVSKVEVLSGRARYDANAEKHHHFVCVQCGRVCDFVKHEWDQFPVPEDVADMGEVQSVHVELRGVCKACAAREEEGETL